MAGEIVLHNQDAPLSAMQVQSQVQSIQQIMHNVMKLDEHYGKIPGCGDKPTLLQPGAQKLALTFGFAAAYDVTQADLAGGHREYNVRCKLTHRATGNFVGEGVGVASTMEGKYRFRVAPKTLTDRVVPKEFWDLRKSDEKAAQRLLGGPGFSAKKGEDNVWYIAEGTSAKVEHDNPADYYNTILKMAKKRAYVDAVLTATAASDIFTQDLEDSLPEGATAATQPAKTSQPAASAPAPAKSTYTRQAPAAAAAPKAAPKPAAPAGTVGIQSVEYDGVIGPDGEPLPKQGKNNKPYLRFFIIDSNGEKFSTFSRSDADAAAQAMEEGKQVKIEFEANQFGKNIKSITVMAGAPSQAAPFTADQTTEGIELPTYDENHNVEDAEYVEGLPI